MLVFKTIKCRKDQTAMNGNFTAQYFDEVKFKKKSNLHPALKKASSFDNVQLASSFPFIFRKNIYSKSR